MSNVRDFVNKRRAPPTQPDVVEVPYQVFKGQKGDKGDKGEPGPEGPAGRDGKDGKDGKDGVDGKDADEAYVLKLVQAIADLRTRIDSLEQDDEEDDDEDEDEVPELEPGHTEELKAPKKFKFSIQRGLNGLIKDVIAVEIE